MMPSGDNMPLNMPCEPQILAGWVVDGQGGPARQNVLISIAGGRIRRLEVLPANCRPAGAFHDLSQSTLMPVLIDAHVHLALSGTRDPELRRCQLSAGAEETYAVIARHLKTCAQSGILALRDGGDREGRVLAYQKAAQPQERASIYVSATCWAWHAPGRYGRMIGRSPGNGLDLGQALPSMPEGLGHLKIIQSGLNSLNRFGCQGPAQFRLDELLAAVAYARMHRLPVMVHANGEEAVAQAIAAGCDSIEHGYFMGAANLARLAESRIAWVPTVIPMQALAQDPYLSSHQRDTALRTRDHQLNQIRQAHQLGVAIVLGTDAGSVGVDHAKAVFEEMGLLGQAGLSLEAVVRCATSRAASLLGLPNGHVIAEGQPASFIAIRRRPAEVLRGIEKIDGVCIRGFWQAMQP
jgi:imidazolonepropionase-like amidohydrolase